MLYPVIIQCFTYLRLAGSEFHMQHLFGGGMCFATENPEVKKMSSSSEKKDSTKTEGVRLAPSTLKEPL